MSNLTAHEAIIIRVLREGGCVSLDTAMTPETLLKKCAAAGLVNSKDVERATVNLIDRDAIEYEMNDNLETTDLWLLNELQD